jgi:ATP-binding cassette, subfamily C, bacteriocin exporter
VKRLKKTFVTQIDTSDCGIACLLSIIKYYKGFKNIENLRELSGTSRQGTTLLGLYQAAQKCGFNAEAFETNIDNLKTIDTPIILHVVIENRLHHYIVCYAYERDYFIIGDPAKGIEKYTYQQLDEIWKSKKLLKLEPNEQFQKTTNQNKKEWKWFWNLMRADVPILTIVSILSLVASAIGLTMAIFSQQLIDKILPNADKTKLIWGIVLLGFIQVVKGWLNYIRGHLLNIQNREFNNRLIDKFYGSLLYLPKFFFSSRKTGELVARMEDTSRIQTVLAFVFSDLIKDVLLVIVSLSLVFFYSANIGLLLLCSTPFFFLVAFIFHKKIKIRQFAVMAANAKKIGNYINTLQGVDTLKIHNKEAEFSKLNKLIYGIFQDKLFDLGKIGISLQFITDVISVAIIISILFITSFMVLAKQLLIGELTALLSISASILPSISSLAFANIRLQGAQIAMERMYEFASVEPENINEAIVKLPKDIEAGSPNIKLKVNDNNFTFNKLAINNLSFRFPGQSQLLKNVSLEVQQGRISALMGECGCGKTTLLYIIEKLYFAESGDISLNSITYHDIATTCLRDLIGVVPQEISIFNGNLMENICLCSSQNEFKKVYEFCLKLGFDKYFATFPQSYATILGDEGVTLSGGQKQLLTLARALYKKPQLLLLDEPTSAMDRNTERFVIDLICSLRNQLGILIITHKLSMAKFADIIYVMEKGVISAKGSHKELLLSQNLYSESVKNIEITA